MGGKIDFARYNRAQRDDLKAACGMTEREREVFEMRADKGNLVAAAQALNMSERTVTRVSRQIEDKIAEEMHRRALRRYMRARRSCRTGAQQDAQERA